MNTEFYDVNLRAFPASKPVSDYEDIPFFASLPELLRNIQQSIGLDIRFIRAGGTLPDLMAQCFTVKVEGGKSPGCLVLLPADPKRCRMTLAEQKNLIASLALLLGEAYRWQQTLRKQEEYLATLTPIPFINPNEKQVNESLFTILKEGAGLIDCHAASLYLLDSNANTLKLRSCWGLPEERLLDPPKPLHRSLADLEGILGQIVILNDDYLFEAWSSPEDFTTAVCVPVMSALSIHGTLWLFSNEKRDFSLRDQRLIEFITGRLAAELERTSLLRETKKISA